MKAKYIHTQTQAYLPRVWAYQYTEKLVVGIHRRTRTHPLVYFRFINVQYNLHDDCGHFGSRTYEHILIQDITRSVYVCVWWRACVSIRVSVAHVWIRWTQTRFSCNWKRFAEFQSHKVWRLTRRWTKFNGGNLKWIGKFFELKMCTWMSISSVFRILVVKRWRSIVTLLYTPHMSIILFVSRVCDVRAGHLRRTRQFALTLKHLERARRQWRRKHVFFLLLSTHSSFYLSSLLVHYILLLFDCSGRERNNVEFGRFGDGHHFLFFVCDEFNA